MLADFDFVVSMGVDTLWPSNGKADSDGIKIIESDIGPMISESRASVYDVMEAMTKATVHPQLVTFTISPLITLRSVK